MGGVLPSRKPRRYRRQPGLRPALAASCEPGQVPEPVVPFPGTRLEIGARVRHPHYSRMFPDPAPGSLTMLSLPHSRVREPLKESCHWALLPFPSS